MQAETVYPETLKIPTASYQTIREIFVDIQISIIYKR
jgi:hypothetical protein